VARDLGDLELRLVSWGCPWPQYTPLMKVICSREKDTTQILWRPFCVQDISGRLQKVRCCLQHRIKIYSWIPMILHQWDSQHEWSSFYDHLQQSTVRTNLVAHQGTLLPQPWPKPDLWDSSMPAGEILTSITLLFDIFIDVEILRSRISSEINHFGDWFC
jgi:hypothetical protein